MSDQLPADMGAPSEPVKARVEVKQAPAEQAGQVPAEVVVVQEKPGEVTKLDKAKNYYKGAIAVVSAILVLLNEVSPVAQVFGPTVQNVITAVIVIVGSVLTLLKSNETWVNKL